MKRFKHDITHRRQPIGAPIRPSRLSAASDIATRPQQTSLNDSVLDLSVGSLQAQASANVIKRSDEMLGSLIDTLA
jgi:hypothetical protein